MIGPGIRTPPADCILGVDLGAPQGMHVDWKALRLAGVSFAILRTTDGVHDVDSTFARNADACDELEIPWGTYSVHEPYVPARAPEQVANLLRTLGDRRPTLPVFCDWELGGHRRPTELFESVDAWCEAIVAANLGLVPAVYTSPAFVDQLNALDGVPGPHPKLQRLKRWLLWLAHYTQAFTKLPRTPVPWIGAPFIWQASGDHFVKVDGRLVLCCKNYSSLPGTDIAVDVDLYRGTLEQLLADVDAYRASLLPTEDEPPSAASPVAQRAP